jgi:hypothetical protein
MTKYTNLHTGATVSSGLLEELYDAMLDETIPVMVNPWSESVLHPSTAFKRTDPAAYRVGFDRWLDAEGWE